MLDNEESISLINKAIKNGFGKDWYYRGGIQGVKLITDDEMPIVVLEVYYMEPGSIYLMSVPLSDFSELLKEKQGAYGDD